jgi:SAM-dependent methyltransferase
MEHNLAVYRDVSTVDAYASDAWLCTGEMTTFHQLARAARGARLLDIGIGAGRTTGLLSLITDAYVGIDYSPEMVAMAKARHPYADLRSGDARNLSDFDDGEFGAVVFSFNGIDTVNHADRARVFDEMRRVLSPGGVLAYSTATKDGPQYPERPWRGLSRPSRHPRALMRSAKELTWRVLNFPNWWRSRRLEGDRGDWAYGALGAHGFRLVCHHVRLREAKRELEAAGFELLMMVDGYGDPVDPHGGECKDRHVFVLARRG